MIDPEFTKLTLDDGHDFSDIALSALRSASHENLWAGGRLVSSDHDPTAVQHELCCQGAVV